MCFAIPGRVVEVNGEEVIVNYSGEKVQAKTLFPVKVGEYVYVSGKIVVEKVPEEDALKAIGVFADVKMTPEQYFFRYAFPCAHIILQRGGLTQEEYDKLEQRFLNNNPPARQELERIFTNAFKFVDKLAKELNKSRWDEEIIYKYWKSYHNEVIDKSIGNFKTAPEAFKNLCKVHLAEVIDSKEQILIVRYENKTRAIHNVFFPEIKFGDKVKVHYAYAVEKV